MRCHLGHERGRDGEEEGWETKERRKKVVGIRNESDLEGLVGGLVAVEVCEVWTRDCGIGGSPWQECRTCLVPTQMRLDVRFVLSN